MVRPPLDRLAHAMVATETVVAGVAPDQWSSPTPCSGWAARDLLAHLTGGNRLFAVALRGEPPAAAGPTAGAAVGSDEDLSAAYQGSARALREAFAADGAMQRTVTVAIGTVPAPVALHLRLVEELVHGWDLARATGQSIAVDDEVVEHALAFTTDTLAGIDPARSPFAPPQPVDEHAAPLDRLVALLGRQP